MNNTASPPDVLQTAGNMLECHDFRDRHKPELLEVTNDRALFYGTN